jgi:hypothetical protein
MPGPDDPDAAGANHKFEADPEGWRKQFWSDDAKTDVGSKTDTKPKGNGADSDGWGEPDMGVLRLRRRPPPALPLEVFGDSWCKWLINAATAAACPVDYVVAPLLASVSTLIGHARWAQASPGWSEPPHLWMVVVGDSGSGKSPGGDCLMRDVLPEIERRMVGDYPERLRDWLAAVEFDKIAKKRWQDALSEALKNKKPLPPMPLPSASDIAPEKPRLRQHDVTIEQTGAILAIAAPKGVAMVRDEIAGWLMGMDAYNPAGRAFGSKPMAAGLTGLKGASTARSRLKLRAWLSRSTAARNPSACANSRMAPMTGCFRACNGRGPTPSHSGSASKRPAWRGPPRR